MEPIILPRISDQKPLVSVVSITYNHEPYIRDCLEGFLMQKTTFPVEVIIHDDASTDHTADIIREYYEKRPDLFHVIIERENLYSQHKPIAVPLYKIAQGSFIAICEGDDYWTDPLKLQKQFDFMESHSDFSVCFHNAIIKNYIDKSEKELYPFPQKEEWSLGDIITGGGDLIPTASLFFRKKCIADYSSFKKNCPVGDYSLAIFLATQGKIKYDNKAMSVYQKDLPGSWTACNRSPKNTVEFSKRMLLWLDSISHTVQLPQAIMYARGRHCLNIYDAEGDYKGIKKDKDALFFLKQQRFTTRVKYFLKIHFSYILKIKREICNRQK